MSKSMEDIYRDHVLSNANEFELVYLSHHGILGQKWGVRRYQNKDGTRTEAGKKHEARLEARKYQKELNSLEQDNAMRSARVASIKKYNKELEKRIKVKEFKGKDSEKLKREHESLMKKVTDLNNGYKENVKRLNFLLSEINSNNNYMWRTSETYYYNYDKRNGESPFSLSSNKTGYYQTATGTRYHVKPSTEKRKSKAKWNLNKNIYSNTPTHTEYYYI